MKLRPKYLIQTQYTADVLLLYVEHVYRFLLFLGALLIRSDHIQAVCLPYRHLGVLHLCQDVEVFVGFFLLFHMSP